MLARDNEQPRGPPRMPRRLLGESRDLEAAAPPPRGPALPRQRPLREAIHAPGQEALLGTWPQHRRAQSPRSVPGLSSPGSFPAAASAARSPSPAFQGPPPHPPAAATGRCFSQSKLCSCVPATNSRRLEAGLLQSHPSSSRGPRIPFVWESQAGIELASLPGGSTLLRPAGVCARFLPSQGSATLPLQGD